MQSPRALIAARFDDQPNRPENSNADSAPADTIPDDAHRPTDVSATDEIRTLAETAGYEVVGEVTQRRPADSGHQLGRGKAEELMRRAAREGVDAVVFDNPLSPRQVHNLRELCPGDVALVDRHRLVLDVFEDRAGTREAQLQVRLAELRYELPRVREEVRIERREANERTARGGERGASGGIDEKEHRRVRDIRERIQRIEAKLDGVDEVGADRRRRLRATGFDYVALAGYTNAGKSTLLQRLASDLDLGENAARHADEAETARAADRLFETLDTITRRADLDGRPVLCTDTVGFVRDLPPWLVESFESTLSVADDADVVLLVVDAADPAGEVREKVTTSLESLADATGTVLPVLNKVDRVDDDHLAAVREAVRSLAAAGGDAGENGAGRGSERTGPTVEADPVAVSALAGDGLDASPGANARGPADRARRVRPSQQRLRAGVPRVGPRLRRRRRRRVRGRSGDHRVRGPARSGRAGPRPRGGPRLTAANRGGSALPPLPRPTSPGRSGRPGNPGETCRHAQPAVARTDTR